MAGGGRNRRQPVRSTPRAAISIKMLLLLRQSHHDSCVSVGRQFIPLAPASALTGAFEQDFSSGNEAIRIDAGGAPRTSSMGGRSCIPVRRHSRSREPYSDSTVRASREDRPGRHLPLGVGSLAEPTDVMKKSRSGYCRELRRMVMARSRLGEAEQGEGVERDRLIKISQVSFVETGIIDLWPFSKYVANGWEIVIERERDIMVFATCQEMT